MCLSLMLNKVIIPSTVWTVAVEAILEGSEENHKTPSCITVTIQTLRMQF
jgi:hypothetical protein